MTALAAPTRAATVLGAGGQVFSSRVASVEVRVGSSDETRTALRFEVAGAGEQRSEIVPGTDDADVEMEPFLFQAYDDPGAVFLVWLSRQNIHDVIHLRHYAAGVWGDDVAVASDEFSSKSGLQAVLTREAEATAGAAAERQVLHLFWQETGGSGLRLQHMPLLFVGGVFKGAGQIRALAELVPAEPAPEGTAPASERLLAQRGRDADELVALFSDSPAQRWVSLAISSTPREVERLARAIHDRVLASTIALDDCEGLANDLERFLLEIPTTLRPGTVRAIASEIRIHIIPGGLRGVGSRRELADRVADDLRASAADVMDRPRRQPATTRVVDARLDQDDPQAEPLHLVVSRIGAWAAPRLPDGAAPILARDGGKAISYWTDAAGALTYRESRADGAWSEPLRFAAGAASGTGGQRLLLQDRADESN